MKKNKYIHVEVVQFVELGDDHDHVHVYDKVIKTSKSPEEVASAFSVDVYPCKKNGVHSEGEGVDFNYTDRANSRTHKERAEHYKELCDAAVGELNFEKCQIEELLNVLTDIELMGDPLIAMVCKNAKEKHHINKLVHTRKLFPISYR